MRKFLILRVVYPGAENPTKLIKKARLNEVWLMVIPNSGKLGLPT